MAFNHLGAAGSSGRTLIRRLLPTAIYLLVILVSGCTEDEIRVLSANRAVPFAQDDVVAVKHVFDQVAKEYNLVPASAADVEAWRKLCFNSSGPIIAQYNFRDPIQLSQDGFHSDHAQEAMRARREKPYSVWLACRPSGEISGARGGRALFFSVRI